MKLENMDKMLDLIKELKSNKQEIDSIHSKKEFFCNDMKNYSKMLCEMHFPEKFFYFFNECEYQKLSNGLKAEIEIFLNAFFDRIEHDIETKIKKIESEIEKL